MKYLILVALLFCSIFSITAQDYMDDLAEESCKCLDTLDESMDKDMLNMQLGLCMLEAAKPYKKKIKKDHGIDLDNIASEGEALGELIGIRMASVCPEGLMRIASLSEESTESESYNNRNAKSSEEFTGELVKIDEGKFVELSVRDQFGKTLKFYWLGFIESQLDLPIEYKSIQNRDVNVFYHTEEFFDARLDEYRDFYVIDKLELKD